MEEGDREMRQRGERQRCAKETEKETGSHTFSHASQPQPLTPTKMHVPRLPAKHAKACTKSRRQQQPHVSPESPASPTCPFAHLFPSFRLFLLPFSLPFPVALPAWPTENTQDHHPITPPEIRSRPCLLPPACPNNNGRKVKGRKPKQPKEGM